MLSSFPPEEAPWVGAPDAPPGSAAGAAGPRRQGESISRGHISKYPKRSCWDRSNLTAK